jgi:hypothetical protein
MPVWHSSAAFQTGRGPLPIEEMRHKQKLRLADKALRLLNGVGKKQRFLFTTDPVGSAIHAQRPLTDWEISQLPEGWMEIPAVDERGAYIPLEL